jgi:hypothetical protein
LDTSPGCFLSEGSYRSIPIPPPTASTLEPAISNPRPYGPLKPNWSFSWSFVQCLGEGSHHLH